MDNVIVNVERDGVLAPVELDEQAFSVDESELERELCQMGRFIFAYGTLDAEVKMRVGRLEAEKERLGAVLDATMRARFEKAGEKATEARIKNAVVTDPTDRKSTRLNSSHIQKSRMPSSA